MNPIQKTWQTLTCHLRPFYSFTLTCCCCRTSDSLCWLYFPRPLKQRFIIWRRGHAGNPRTTWRVWSTLSAVRCTCRTSTLWSAPLRGTQRMSKQPKKSNVTSFFCFALERKKQRVQLVLLQLLYFSKARRKTEINNMFSFPSSLVPKENSRFGQMSSSGHQIRSRPGSRPSCE